MSTEPGAVARCAIAIECEVCDESLVETAVDHGRDTSRYHAILDAHRLRAERHAEETGHSVEVVER